MCIISWYVSNAFFNLQTFLFFPPCNLFVEDSKLFCSVFHGVGSVDHIRMVSFTMLLCPLSRGFLKFRLGFIQQECIIGGSVYFSFCFLVGFDNNHFEALFYKRLQNGGILILLLLLHFYLKQFYKEKYHCQFFGCTEVQFAWKMQSKGLVFTPY